jgi:membrane-bound lytic murein transglycosylase B
MGRRFGLLTRQSVQKGLDTLTRHKEILRAAEGTSRVDKEIIVAILRIETNFGSHTGKRPVLNSLLTMSIIENRRSEWAEGELAELLRICSAQRCDPLSIMGSWAGAFGIPQFIPSSYRRFAVDGNGDGAVDLFDFHDAIASVAYYLQSHGWERNDAVRARAAVYAYNRCENYVDAVFAYAGALKKGEARPVRGKPKDVRDHVKDREGRN